MEKFFGNLNSEILALEPQKWPYLWSSFDSTGRAFHVTGNLRVKTTSNDLGVILKKLSAGHSASNTAKTEYPCSGHIQSKF